MSSLRDKNTWVLLEVSKESGGILKKCSLSECRNMKVKLPYASYITSLKQHRRKKLIPKGLLQIDI